MKLLSSNIAAGLLLALTSLCAQALTLEVRGQGGQPLELVMVTLVPNPVAKIDASANRSKGPSKPRGSPMPWAGPRCPGALRAFGCG
jgi:hypothetical protein